MRYSYYQGVASEGSNRLMLIVSAALLACLAVFIAITQSVGATSSTIVAVTGNTSPGENQPGWMFNRDLTTQTPYEFNSDES